MEKRGNITPSPLPSKEEERRRLGNKGEKIIKVKGEKKTLFSGQGGLGSADESVSFSSRQKELKRRRRGKGYHLLSLGSHSKRKKKRWGKDREEGESRLFLSVKISGAREEEERRACLSS